MIPLAEMQQRVAHYHHQIQKDTRWKLCAACPLKECQPKSRACQCRKLINLRRRESARANVEREKAVRSKWRKANSAKCVEANRAYRRECSEYINVTRRAHYARNSATIKLQERVRALQKKLDLAIEDGTVSADECAPVSCFS